MNEMDRNVAADPTLTDKQKWEHKFGNAFQALSMVIEYIISMLRAMRFIQMADKLENARDTYVAEMREFLDAMEAAPKTDKPKYELRGALEGLLDNLEQLEPGDEDAANDWENQRDYLVVEVTNLTP